MANKRMVWQADTILVTALDVGTSYSGYAFAFKNDPSTIHTNAAWNAGVGRLLTHKTPTCLLLNPNKLLDSFGYEAETKYAELTEDKEHVGWLFFRHFKMFLHKKEVSCFGNK